MKHIFNESVDKATLNILWKCGYILALPKVPASNRLEELKPVNVLPTFSKLFEQAIHAQVILYFNKQLLLSVYQSSFRKNLVSKQHC